jgi:hypothetical protein
MFELSNRLVGIYKTADSTKSVTIDPRAFGVSDAQDGARTPGRKTLAPLNTNSSQIKNKSPMRKMVIDEDVESLDGMEQGIAA